MVRRKHAQRSVFEAAPTSAPAPARSGASCAPSSPDLVRDALTSAQRRLGQRLHLDVYLEHLQSHVVDNQDPA